MVNIILFFCDVYKVTCNRHTTLSMLQGVFFIVSLSTTNVHISPEIQFIHVAELSQSKQTLNF